MGIFDRFKTSESKMAASSRSDPMDTTAQSVDPLVVLPVNILGGRQQDKRDLRAQNRYALADSIYNSDERIYSAIELMALMIQKSIGKVSIASIHDDDGVLSNEEKNAVDEANKFAKDLGGVGIPRLFYHYTIDLWKYGDAVDVIRFDSRGITDLVPVPMQAITAVDKRNQLGADSMFDVPMITNPKWYALDEQATAPGIPDQIFNKNRILHISFNPRRNQIRDNMTRWTMNVWSVAPINSLIGIITWKEQLIRNDMIWRNRAVPREHHILDLSQFDMSKFSGTFEQKQAASKAAAEKAIREYNASMQRREADQGYVSGQGVEIKYVEPKTASYMDPMPIIDQVNTWIGGPTGTPAALMGGESKGFTSLVHSASFLALRAEKYAEPIQRAMEMLIKRHVSLARPGIRKSVVNRLFIKNRLILDRDRAELAKIISVLTESKIFTPNEIRQIWGLDPQTETQMKEIKKWIKDTNTASTFGRSGASVAGAGTQQKRGLGSGEATKGQESPGKRDNDLIQKKK